ncbi:MAG: NUDIX hydrolase [Candidatus Omnitrophota bacterium]
MKKISEHILFEGKWLRLKRAVFLNAAGEEVVWESVERKDLPDSIVIIPKLVPSGKFVLIKQFRHPLEKYVIGFPAGLYAGDLNHALKELKEETGYTGRIVDASPELKANSGMTNMSTRVVYAEIDENAPVNKYPEQELEPSEDIEVLLVEKKDMKGFLMSEYEKGAEIGAGLWYIFVTGPML